MVTWIYEKTAGYINMALRPFDLLLMAEYEGDPPERPMQVRRVWVQRRSITGLWP